MATEQLKQALSGLQQQVKDNKTTVAAVATGLTAVAAGAYMYRRARLSAVPKSGPYTQDTLPAGAYDAVIVGAGPSGSTCAHFMAKEGAKVALLDKATFPRGACQLWIVQQRLGAMFVSFGGRKDYSFLLYRYNAWIHLEQEAN
jgi:hypothetical protein